MKYLLSLRVFEEMISPTQNSDSVIRQDKEASSTSARPHCKKKWDSFTHPGNPGSLRSEKKEKTKNTSMLHFTVHRDRIAKMFYICFVSNSPLLLILLLGNSWKCGRMLATEK